MENLGSQDVRALVSTLVARERARQSLIDFAMFIDSRYRPYPVHRLIAKELEAVERGDVRRLAIFVPPASGKSRLASELFPAWFFGRNPESEFIETSYDYDLAASFGRSVRNILKLPSYHLLFSDVGIADDAAAMDDWHTTQRGEYKAEGVGGGLIGFHAHIAVIDDPVKNYASVSTKKSRDDLWDWYNGVLLNRMRPYREGKGAVILIMQRWHDDDLGGKILRANERGEDLWHVVSIPSVAEPGDPLGRSPGEVLLPEGPNRRTLEELRQLQADNPALFMVLHQQRPMGESGEIFKRGWLIPYGPAELPKKLTPYLTTDFALSQGKGDYTVLIAFGVCSEGNIWLLDLWRSRCSILAGVEQTIQMMRQYKPVRCFVEKTGLSRAFGPLLDRRKQEERVYCVVDPVSVLGLGGKASPDRVGSIAGAMEMGKVRVPEGARWLGELEYELSRFPSGEHDDQVDALALIGLQLRSLRRASHKEPPSASGRVVVLPKNPTFQEALDINRRRRLGQPVRPFSLVAGNVS